MCSVMQLNSVVLSRLLDPAVRGAVAFEGLECADEDIGASRGGLPDEAVIWHRVAERPRGGVLAFTAEGSAVRCT